MDSLLNNSFSSTLPSSTINSSTSAVNNVPGEFAVNLVTITYVSLMSGIIMFAVLGNVLVILVFLFEHRLRVSTSYYMLSLAVSDVITAALVMTLEVDQLVHGFKWQHSMALCEAWTSAYLFTVPVSILTACVSSIDRWYAIAKPLRYRTGRNGLKQKAMCAIVVVWIYSILFALIPKMGWNPGHNSNETYSSQDFCIFDIKQEYSILSSVLNFIIPSFITAIFYYNMFTVMKKQTKTRRKLSTGSEYSHRSPSQKGTERLNLMRNVNLAKSYALIGSLLIITWCPFTIISVITNVCLLAKTKTCSALLPINPNIEYGFLMIGYFNSAVNPVVYVLRFRAFRVTIRSWFCSCTNKKRYLHSH